MRTVTFGCANSLDNFIARADHSVDWLRWSPEVARIVGAFWKSIDTVVMGRKTYEVALQSGTPAYPGVKNYVFSRTLVPHPNHPVEIVADDPVAFVSRLKRRRGKGICVMGGGQLGHTLLAGGVVDEIGVNIHPVLLGGGVPLFHSLPHQIDLELLLARRLKNGCIYLLYRVKRRRSRTSAEKAALPIGKGQTL
jgi:dihydrofolate reductase